MTLKLYYFSKYFLSCIIFSNFFIIKKPKKLSKLLSCCDFKLLC